MFDIFVQLIGYAGVLGFIISYLQKSRKGIIAFSFSARLLFVIHYILLGGYAGAIQNAVGGIASAVSAQRGKKPFDSSLTPIFIIALTIVGGIFTFDSELGIISVLPVMAMILQNSALWFKNQTLIRIVTLAGIPLWFIYNITKGSAPGMTSDALSTASLITAIVKYDIVPRMRKKIKK